MSGTGRIVALGTLVLAAMLATPAAAQDAELDCENAQAQQDMNMCAYRDFEEADAELNAIWKDARAMARELDEQQDESLRGADKALLAAQRGWIAYRDGHCEVAGFEARGGSMEPMLVSYCKAELTRRRTTELREFVEGPTN